MKVKAILIDAGVAWLELFRRIIAQSGSIDIIAVLDQVELETITGDEVFDIIMVACDEEALFQAMEPQLSLYCEKTCCCFSQCGHGVGGL